MRIVIDCANGAAYKVAPKLIKSLGAEVIVIGNNPDGTNINKNVGQHTLSIWQAWLKNNADIGISLDGDADSYYVVMKKEKLSMEIKL